MVTENGRLEEVTEAAERMGLFRCTLEKGNPFNHGSTGVHTGEKHRGLITDADFCGFSSVKLCALCGCFFGRLNPASSPPVRSPTAD
jgi:hypothetical protein